MKSAMAGVAWMAALAVGATAAMAQEVTLRPAGRVELPGYTGDFDHFDYDMKSNRLWLAAEDHGTLDIFDLHTLQKQASLKGVVDTPHGILFVPEKNRLIVTDTGGDMQTRVIDATSNKVTANIKLPAPGADAIGYDPSRRRLYIVNGGRDAKMQETFLSAIDPVSLQHHGDLKFDTDKVEAMGIQSKGNKLFITVTGRNYVAVVDKEKMIVLDTWPIKEAQQSAPMAYDEQANRLFVVARKPGTMIVLDAASGRTVASFKAPEHCDQVIWDADNQRAYALGGEGYIGVFAQRNPEKYEELARIASAPGAKTGILVRELGQLIVAASPGDGKPGGALLRYEILAAPGGARAPDAAAH